MKLIFCNECQDVIKLLFDKRSCSCGKSSGKYNDDLHAEIEGPCTPIGFANSTLAMALRNRPKRGLGKEFVAFVMPEECPTIKVNL